MWFLLATVLASGVFEDRVTAKKELDPLREIVRVEFKHESGDKLTAAAFFDGGWSWVVRFAPPKAGTWRYRWTVVSDRAGSFKAKKPAPGVTLSRDRRHFVDERGKPWFWVADTAWNGAMFATKEEWREYLDIRRKQGYNAVQFVTTQWRAGRKDENGRVAFTFDHGKLAIVPEFFQRLDERFETLQQMGFAAVPVQLWALTSKEKESPGENLPDEEAGLLARYINFRYGAYSALWFLGGDGDYRDAKAEKWKRIARIAYPDGIVKRPASLHPRGGQQPFAAMKDEPWLDFFSYQSGHGTAPAKWRWQAEQGPAKDWKLDPPHPVIDTEPNYEAHMSYQKRLIDAYDVRRASWYSVLAAPPAGITYGAHGIWPWMREKGVPLDHANSGEAEPWRDCLKYEGGKQVGILHALLQRVEWWRLRPDPAFVNPMTTAADFSDYTPTTMSYDQKFALVYLPRPRKSISLASGHWTKAEWWNPRTGKTDKTKIAPMLTPPAEDDWVLYLSR